MRRSSSSASGPVVAGVLALARRAHARGDQLEEPAVGLLGVALDRAGGDVGEALAESLEQVAQLVGLAGDARRQRDAAAERRDALLVLAQAGVPHQLERGAGHARRDVRVAVAVAADPRSERQQRRDRHVGVRVRRADRRLEVAVDVRHDGGERRREVDEPGADLVEHRRRDGAQLVGDPHLLHGGGDLAPQVHLLDARRPALVELAQQREDARELGDRRATAGLGRVGGEDEAHLGGGERLQQLVGARAVGGELRDGRVQRAASRAGPLVEGADPAHAIEVLGEVHEQKPARQHPDQQHDLGELEAATSCASWSAASASPLRERSPRSIALRSNCQRFGALDGADDLVEDAAEQRLVVGVAAGARFGCGDGAHVIEGTWRIRGGLGPDVNDCGGGVRHDV